MPTDLEKLLAEIEGVLSSAPGREAVRHSTDANFAWLGRAAAAIEQWNLIKGVMFNLEIRQLYGYGYSSNSDASMAFNQMLVMLHQAHNDLRMRTIGPVSIAVGAGRVFDYFDELRKLIEVATDDVFFVDPYLGADIVSRYLTLVRRGVTVRLLSGEFQQHLNPLVSAINAFNTQNGTTCAVRTVSSGLHDRYLFIDKANCYQSGASFKDGALKAATTVTQVTDAFQEVWNHYEQMWTQGTPRT